MVCFFLNYNFDTFAISCDEKMQTKSISANIFFSFACFLTVVMMVFEI